MIDKFLHKFNLKQLVLALLNALIFIVLFILNEKICVLFGCHKISIILTSGYAYWVIYKNSWKGAISVVLALIGIELSYGIFNLNELILIIIAQATIPLLLTIVQRKLLLKMTFAGMLLKSLILFLFFSIFAGTLALIEVYERLFSALFKFDFIFNEWLGWHIAHLSGCLFFAPIILRSIIADSEYKLIKKGALLSAPLILLALFVNLFYEVAPRFEKLNFEPIDKTNITQKIILADDRSYAPFVFIDATGAPSGIVVDLWKLWSERNNIPIEFKLMEWDSALKAVVNGDADAVSGIFRTPQREEIYSFTEPYCNINVNIYFNSEINGLHKLSDLEGFKVGVIKGDASDELVTQNCPKTIIERYSSAEELVKDARMGKIKVFVSDALIIRFYLSKHTEGAIIKESSSPVIVGKLCAAVNKDNLKILNLIQKGMNNISDNEKQAIFDAWTGVSTFSRFDWRILTVIFGGIIALGGLLLVWNFQLKNQVRKATAKLQEQNEELAQSEERFRTVFKDSTDVYFIIIDGVIVECNRAIEKMFLARIEDIVGKRPEELSPKYQPNGVSSADMAVFTISEVFRLGSYSSEWIHTKSDGSEFPVEISFSALMFKGRQALFAALRDITERKNNEAKILELNETLEKKVVERTAELNFALKNLEEANIELKQLNDAIADEANKLQYMNEMLIESENRLKIANQTKDKFFSLISHDIRNPLTALMLSTEYLDSFEERLSQEQKSLAIKNIYNSAYNLFKLTNNLLTWARSQSDAISFKPDNANINSIIEDNIATLSNNIEQKELNIKVKSIRNANVKIDVNMINSVVANLLSNAIKFTKKGGSIEVGDIVDGEKPNIFFEPNFACFYIKDSGIGMQKSEIDKLFKLGENVSKNGTDGEASSGLGLIIAKEFIEKHGGKIWAESIVDLGSTFYFTLPLNIN